MIELVTRKTYSGLAPVLLKREIGTLAREAGHFAGVYWHQHFRPLHFLPIAFARYGYAVRSKKYSVRKYRLKGHSDPLVFSGESRRRTEIEDVRARYRGGVAHVSVVMHAPTLNFRRHPESPDMRGELTTLIPEELAEIGQATNEFLRRRLALMRQSVVTMAPEILT